MLCTFGLTGGAAYVSGERVGGAPEISIQASADVIGKAAQITVEVTESTRGLGRVEVLLVQDDWRRTLAERAFTPQRSWAPWDARTEREKIVVEVGSASIERLADGPAQIMVVAERAGTWRRRAPATSKRYDVSFRVTPPSIRLLRHSARVAQGGCAVVVYEVAKTSVEDGVQVGARFFEGHPLPDAAPQQRFAFLAIPYDVESAEGVRLVATDEVGNRGEQPVELSFVPRPLKKDMLNVSEAVMAKIVRKILSSTPNFRDRGGVLANYVAMNSELRAENARRIDEVSKESRQDFLWSRRFIQMDSKVFGAFADRRTYMHEGRKIDQQDHLGFDLASIKNARIPAANGGVVVLAERLGIYGNAVVIDHGYGLSSLYAHLSRIDVKPGETVKRRQIIGLTGSTGLSLGDHLHFTMLLRGLAVNPLEWWNQDWIGRHIVAHLGDALPFQYDEEYE